MAAREPINTAIRKFRNENDSMLADLVNARARLNLMENRQAVTIAHKLKLVM